MKDTTSRRSVKVLDALCRAAKVQNCWMERSSSTVSGIKNWQRGLMDLNFDRRTNRDLTKECDFIKKLIALVLTLVCVIGLVGCGQKAVRGSEVYSFPEPTTMITGSFYSQGQETKFEIGSEEYDPNDLSTNSIIKWFYDLKLTACDKPETVEGSEIYSFQVKGENAFTYEDRGSEAYIIIGGNYYKVSNPFSPPID